MCVYNLHVRECVCVYDLALYVCPEVAVSYSFGSEFSGI